MLIYVLDLSARIENEAGEGSMPVTEDRPTAVAETSMSGNTRAQTSVLGEGCVLPLCIVQRTCVGDSKPARLGWSLDRYFFPYLLAPVRSSLAAICLAIRRHEERLENFQS